MGITTLKEYMRMGESSKHQKEERRQYTRVSTNLYITYTMPGAESNEAGVFVTKNASGGGFGFESFEKIPLGTVFELTIHLPTLPFPLEAKGKVVRVDKTRLYGRYEVGISILKIAEEDRRELIKYLVSTIFTQNDCNALFGGEEKNFKEIFKEDSYCEIETP